MSRSLRTQQSENGTVNGFRKLLVFKCDKNTQGHSLGKNIKSLGWKQLQIQPESATASPVLSLHVFWLLLAEAPGPGVPAPEHQSACLLSSPLRLPPSSFPLLLPREPKEKLPCSSSTHVLASTPGDPAFMFLAHPLLIPSLLFHA